MPEERRPPHGATDGIADFEAARRVREKAGCALSPPPDGGYGWVVLCANFCVNAFTWGIVAVGNYQPSTKVVSLMSGMTVLWRVSRPLPRS